MQQKQTWILSIRRFTVRDKTLVPQALQNVGFQHITIEYEICLIDRGESFTGS